MRTRWWADPLAYAELFALNNVAFLAFWALVRVPSDGPATATFDGPARQSLDVG